MCFCTKLHLFGQGHSSRLSQGVDILTPPHTQGGHNILLQTLNTKPCSPKPPPRIWVALTKTLPSSSAQSHTNRLPSRASKRTKRKREREREMMYAENSKNKQREQRKQGKARDGEHVRQNRCPLALWSHLSSFGVPMVHSLDGLAGWH